MTRALLGSLGLGLGACCLQITGPSTPGGTSAGSSTGVASATGTTTSRGSTGSSTAGSSTGTSTAAASSTGTSSGGGSSTGAASSTGTSSGGIVTGECLIDGKSYSPRAANPLDAAQCCNPDISPRAWLPLFTRVYSFPVNSTTIAGSNDGVVGDLNGDGIADAVALAYITGQPPLQSQAWVYLSQDGGLTGPTVYASTQPGEDWPGYLWFGDLNKDGLPDLLVSTNDSLDVFLNQGAGQFGNEISIGGCDRGRMRLIDANGDGWMDVVELTQYCGLVLFLNTAGDGGLLGPAQSLFGATPGDLAVGDFNADGITDLIFDDQNGILAWLQNSPTGLSSTEVEISGSGGHIVSFPYGPGDALAAVEDNASVSIYTPTDAGPTNTGNYQLLSGGGPISAGDVNGDGLPDLLITDAVGVEVLLNQGNAVFGTPGEAMVPLDAGPGMQSVGIQTIGAGDLNGDGAIDLVVFRGDGPLEGWINTCGSGAAALLDAGVAP